MPPPAPCGAASSGSVCSAEVFLRVVVFTDNPELERTHAWTVVRRAMRSGRILVCLTKAGTNASRDPSAPAGDELGISAEYLSVASADERAARVALTAWNADWGILLGAREILPDSLALAPRGGTLVPEPALLPLLAQPRDREPRDPAPGSQPFASWLRFGASSPVVASDHAPRYPDDSPLRLAYRKIELASHVLAGVIAKRQRVRATSAQDEAPRGSGIPTSPPLRAEVPERKRARHAIKATATLLALGVVAPVRDALRSVRRRQPVRIFTFHRVSDLCRDGMTVSPAEFRRQVVYIARRHDVRTLAACVDALESGARLRRPLAAITFDDAYRSVYDHALPIMRELGVPATVFVTTELVGSDARFAHDVNSPVRRHLEVMSWDELRRLRDLGWEIGGHSASHRRLSVCDEATLEYELRAPLEALRTHLQVARPSMAYPFGGRADATPATMARARALGYRACCSDYGGENFPDDDPFHLLRFEIGGDHAPLAWRCRARGIALGDWGSRLGIPSGGPRERDVVTRT